ncbi:MAG: hypothetical protein WAM75_16975 [Xanthobacteraceae bacterium]
MTAETSGSVVTWWAVISAFGGTVIGGGISYFLARMNLNAASKQRDEDRLRTRQALAYSLLFKIMTIVSRLHHIRQSIREMFAEAEKAGFRGEPWNVMRPVVPIPARMNFLAEEMALVLSIDDKTFNEISSLDEIHNSTMAVLATYGTQRSAVMAHFGAEMNGAIGTTKLTREQAEWLAPRTFELNQIAKEFVTRIEQDAETAKTALKSLHATLEKELKLKKKLEFV